MQWLAGIAHTHKHTVTQHTAPEQHTIHVDLLFWNSIVNVLVKVVLSAVRGVTASEPSVLRMDEPDAPLIELLESSGFGVERRQRVLQILEDEALTLALLRDMGISLRANLCELALSHEEVDMLTSLVLRPRYPTRSTTTPAHPVQTPSDVAKTAEMPSSAQTVALGAVVEPIGELALRWQRQELSYGYTASSTIGDLREWLYGRTDVPAERQRLIGWSSKHKKLAEQNDTLLADLALGSRTACIMVLGTPQREAALAEAQLSRARHGQRFIENDLKPPPPPPSSSPPSGSGSARRSSSDRRPIHADRGGGICLDPSVWAPDPDEIGAARGRRTGHDPRRHIVNPTTRRLERLDLSNALLSNEVAPPGEDDRLEEGPENVDLLGIVRGRCRGCTQCDAYARPDRPAANHNDVEVLNCRRCGCPSHQHHQL